MERIGGSNTYGSQSAQTELNDQERRVKAQRELEARKQEKIEKQMKREQMAQEAMAQRESQIAEERMSGLSYHELANRKIQLEEHMNRLEKDFLQRRKMLEEQHDQALLALRKSQEEESMIERRNYEEQLRRLEQDLGAVGIRLREIDPQNSSGLQKSDKPF